MSFFLPVKRSLLTTGLFALALFLLATSSSARAADTVYWANWQGANISFANLAGGGGGELNTAGASAVEINGLAIDSGAGKIYWISTADGKVRFANLSGGGGGELNTLGASASFPVGLAIDPAGGRVYWSDATANKISFANLNGSGGGELNTFGATIEDPLGVAIDPANGRIYWSNGEGLVEIASANLNGTGGGANLNTAGASGANSNGGAIDSAAGRIYWADYVGNKISFANLNGSGGGILNTAGATVSGPFGVAVDPTAGRVYWANEVGGSISYANTNGTGGGNLDTAGAPAFKSPDFPVLLKTPSPAAAPQASGGPKPGSALSCVQGTWAPDLLQSYLFQAPQTTSFQWLLNGQPIGGATVSPFTASAVGLYSCQSTATNHAGSATQTSTPIPIFKLGKVKLNKKKGTATLSVQVPGAGKLTLSGKQVVKQTRTRSAATTGTVKLTVKAKGKAKKKLGKKSKAKVKAKIAFAPLGGIAGSQTKSITLKKKLKR
jgi:hypothetical protein